MKGFPAGGDICQPPDVGLPLAGAVTDKPSALGTERIIGPESIYAYSAKQMS